MVSAFASRDHNLKKMNVDFRNTNYVAAKKSIGQEGFVYFFLTLVKTNAIFMSMSDLRQFHDKVIFCRFFSYLRIALEIPAFELTSNTQKISSKRIL